MFLFTYDFLLTVARFVKWYSVSDGHFTRLVEAVFSLMNALADSIFRFCETKSTVKF